MCLAVTSIRWVRIQRKLHRCPSRLMSAEVVQLDRGHRLAAAVARSSLEGAQLIEILVLGGVELPVSVLLPWALAQGSRSGRPRKRNWIQSSSTSARCLSSPARVSADVGMRWRMLSALGSSVLPSNVVRW